MKKKILITSILLSLTTAALIGYFVGGCSSLKEVALRQKEASGVTYADVNDAAVETGAQPVVTAVPEEPTDGLEDRALALEHDISAQEDKEALDLVVKIDSSRIPHTDEATYPKNWRELVEGRPNSRTDSLVVHDAEPSDGGVLYEYHPQSGFKLDPSTTKPPLRPNGSRPVGGMMGGGFKPQNGDPNAYSSSGYGGGMGGMMGGGMGGRGSRRYGRSYGGVQPTGPQTWEAAGRQTYSSSGWRGGSRRNAVSVRSVPVELINVSADELWIIAKSDVQTAPVPPDEHSPGTGAMLAKLPKKDKKIPLPLKHTDVKGQISGYIATVNVTQQFHNPYDEKIEAVYVFPLPQNAAINEFIMTVGGRRIRGIIRERKQAERIYQQARTQGHVASLLTQERPNIFTQKVANIEPRKQIDVNIKYFNTLAYVDGWYEFVFPMVVGPRFNPPGFTDGVGAVARGKAGISGQKTEVQYLKPGERSGHDISLAVDIDAGVAIEKLMSSSHVITNSSASRQRRTVKLSSLDSIPNKDFVLRYKVAGKTVKSALVTHRDKRGGFFTLMLYPPENLSYLKRAPMEMIFVLDCSGSMSGKPIAKAKQAITRALKKLQPGDTFQVIRFSNNASQLGAHPVPATPTNIRRGLKYVESLHGSGGTMMIEGIKAALGFAHDPRRFRLVSFMTDGYIGNEAQILAEVHNSLGASRIFSFGVGSSVNRYLLDRMAKIGKGAVAYVGPDDSAGDVVDQFYDRISHPALADVEIDWGSMEVADMQPFHIPDLFVGRPVIVTGRFKGNDSTTIRVTGRVGDLTQEMEIPVHLGSVADTHPGIPCVWARKKIETLGNQATYDSNPDLPGEIRQVALEYGLMSSYTAFIAVDSSRKTAGDHGITVAVPVPVPDGVRYETTVQN